tara:strand:- start:3483 stop:6287 length:2805 start_codon:yes stop_codon:yes gene_type:complete
MNNNTIKSQNNEYFFSIMTSKINSKNQNIIAKYISKDKILRMVTKPVLVDTNMEMYHSYSKQNQVVVKKSLGYWFLGKFKNDDRSCELDFRSGVSIDIDDGNLDFDKLVIKLETLNVSYILHTTLSHTKFNRKYRILIPTTDYMNSDEYVYNTKCILERLEVDFDDVSLRPKQIMFLPAALKNAEYKYKVDLDKPKLEVIKFEQKLEKTLNYISKKDESFDPISYFKDNFNCKYVLENFNNGDYSEDNDGQTYSYIHGTSSKGVKFFSRNGKIDSNCSSFHSSDPLAKYKSLNSFDLWAILTNEDLYEENNLSQLVDKLLGLECMDKYHELNYLVKLYKKKYWYLEKAYGNNLYIKAAYFDMESNIKDTLEKYENYYKQNEKNQIIAIYKTLEETHAELCECLIINSVYDLTDDIVKNKPIFVSNNDKELLQQVKQAGYALNIRYKLTNKVKIYVKKSTYDYSIDDFNNFVNSNGDIISKLDFTIDICRGHKSIVNILDCEPANIAEAAKCEIEFDANSYYGKKSIQQMENFLKVRNLKLETEIVTHKEYINDIYQNDMNYFIICVKNAFVSLGLKITDTDLEDWLKGVSLSNSFNAFKRMVDSKSWDGKSRIEQFLNQLPTENDEFKNEILPHFFAQTICLNFFNDRRMEKLKEVLLDKNIMLQAKAETMLILTGNQGTGKGSFVQSLLPHALALSHIKSEQTYSFKANQADECARVMGATFSDFSEMGGMLRNEEKNLKQLMSKTSDTYRLPYARRVVDNPRLTVFLGSENDYTFLHDSTGSRRYLPLLISDQIRLDRNIDMQQLYAELAHKVFSCTLMPFVDLSLTKKWEEYTRSFTYETVTMGLIHKYFHTKEEDTKGSWKNFSYVYNTILDNSDMMNTDKSKGSIERALQALDVKITISCKNKRYRIKLRDETLKDDDVPSDFDVLDNF